MTAHTELWRDSQRRRLVGLCAAITSDRDAAEDLAQETLLEAWRHRHKLHDPAGADRWLSAIARNVCRRWARRRGRELPLADLDTASELEVDLEGAELAELLDRALAQLPPTTRDVLVQRYVEASPHAEIAARLGLSEDAVSMRLTRGKLVLRKVLAAELRPDEVDAWQETRIWCSSCGRRRLAMRRDAHLVSFRCPGCSSSQPGAVYELRNPAFGRMLGDVVRPSAILGRTAEWSRDYFAGGAGSEAACTRCGAAVRLRRYVRNERPGLYAQCDACGETVSSSLLGLAQALPEVRALRRPSVLRRRELEHGGCAAIALRYRDVLGAAVVDVVLARDTLRILKIA